MGPKKMWISNTAKVLKILKILGTFPKAFSQAATSQGYFSKWQLPKGIFPSGNFPIVQFSALAAALGPPPCSRAHHSRSARPPPNCSLWRLRGPNLIFGKVAA